MKTGIEILNEIKSRLEFSTDIFNGKDDYFQHYLNTSGVTNHGGYVSISYVKSVDDVNPRITISPSSNGDVNELLQIISDIEPKIEITYYETTYVKKTFKK